MIAFSIYSVSNFQICNIVLLTLVTSLCIILLWTLARRASLSFTISRSLLKFLSIDSVMANHLILCCPLLLLPLNFPSLNIFSNESALCIRWPKFGVSASTAVLPMNIQCSFPLRVTSLISLLSKGL